MNTYRHLTRHHYPGGLIRHVGRNLKDVHLAAGYHRQEWGAAAHPGHGLIGDHETTDGVIRVVYVEDMLASFEGPAFLLTFPDGSSVDAIDDTTVQAYLELHQAAAQLAGVAPDMTLGSPA